MEVERGELDERRLPGRQTRLLFAYLALANGRPVPRDEIAEALWEDALPATWEKALGVLASKLRTVLSEMGVDGSSALTAAFGCYRLDLPDGTWVDVVEAAAACCEAEALLAAHEPERAARAAELAESVAGLAFLPGDDGAWVQAKRRELDDIRVRALTVLAEASLQSKKAADAIRWTEQAIEAMPFRESGYRLLMTAHIAAGNRAEALCVYERCRRLLAEELGSYPSPETESIYRALLDMPSSMDMPPAGPPQPRPPEAPRSRTSRRRRLVLGVAVLIGAAAAALIFALASPGGRDLQPDSVIRVDPGTLRVTQVARVGDAPDLIVAAGGYLWVTNWILRDSDLGTGRNAGDLGLWRVDPATGRSEPVGGGVSPCGIAADPSGNVWVANCFAPKLRQSSNVTLVDAMTTKFKKTVLVPGGDNFFRGIAFGGGFLWLGRSPSASARVDTVWQVDPRLDGKLLGAVRIVHPPGALGWSSHYGDLWTTGFGDGSLTRIHPATGKVTTIEHAGVNPDWMAFADGSVWVADWSKPALVRLNETGPALPRSIPLPVANRRACLNVSCIWTVAAGAGAIWATTPRDRALWRIDPKTDRVRRISLPYEPAGVTVSAGEVWVTVRGR